eukprot:gene19842-21784_t
MSSKKKAPVREIPGFYYDEDKRRYFKITKDFPRKPAFSREKNQMAENENFTKTKPKKRSMSIVILVAKQEVRPLRQYTRRFNYIQHHTWTSCLVPDPSRNVLLPAIGINGGVLMADNDFSWRPLLRTTKSDVLALAYNHHPKRHASVAKAKSSVDNIKQLESSEFLFLISTLAGHVELWDSRGFKPVISYPGHNNSHSMLQLHLDGNEEFVASVGEDCVTRIWELRNANLINSLPSIRFDKCDKPVMPAIAFIGGNMLPSTTRGLLYAIQDDVYFKSL